MKTIKAEVIAIGDELLYGQIQDTNSHWISGALDRIGVKVVRRTTVGDHREDILRAFEQAGARADIVLITGGLGPTSDDLTKPLLASFFDCGLELVQEALIDLTAYFQKRGRELTETNRLQAYLPTKCTYVKNTAGTAPGMWFFENGVYWMSMPGVPHEMRKLMKDFVLPELRRQLDLPVIYHKLVRTVGIGESWLADLLKDWENNLPNHMKLAYLPELGEVKLRLTSVGEDHRKLADETEEQLRKCMPLIGDYVYGFDGETLPTVIGKLLKDFKKTVALAESCSGGYLSHLITSVPGSSTYFRGSIVPYDNSIKVSELEVSVSTLEKAGAVSEETVKEMARNVRRKFGVDFGVSTSGIAGPSGGTADKPVGTIWLACDHQGDTRTKKLQLSNDREVNIHLTAVAALDLLLRCILK